MKQTVISLLFLLFATGDLYAQGKQNPLSLTVTAGGYSFDTSQDADTAALAGVKIGYDLAGKDLLHTLWLEGVFHYLTAADVDGYLVRADALYPLVKKKKFVPFLAIGAGYASIDGSDGSEGDPIISYGGGLQYFLRNYLAVRFDVRHTLWFNADRIDNVEYTAGLRYLFGQEREKKPVPPPDADGDGVPDRQDTCPETPKTFKVDRRGCPVDAPDGDRDGVADYLDRCPGTPKDVKVGKDGCPPDADGDGVPDYRDECPGTAGLHVDERGCVRIEKAPRPQPRESLPAPNI